MVYLFLVVKTIPAIKIGRINVMKMKDKLWVRGGMKNRDIQSGITFDRQIIFIYCKGLFS